METMMSKHMAGVETNLTSINAKLENTATKEDVERSRQELRTEMQEKLASTKRDIKTLKTEVETSFVEANTTMKRGMQQLKDELDTYKGRIGERVGRNVKDQVKDQLAQAFETSINEAIPTLSNKVMEKFDDNKLATILTAHLDEDLAYSLLHSTKDKVVDWIKDDAGTFSENVVLHLSDRVGNRLEEKVKGWIDEVNEINQYSNHVDTSYPSRNEQYTTQDNRKPSPIRSNAHGNTTTGERDHRDSSGDDNSHHTPPKISVITSQSLDHRKQIKQFTPSLDKMGIFFLNTP